MKSFRVRIAFFNVFISCLILFVMGAVSLLTIYQMELREVDRQLLDFGKRGLPSFHHMDGYSRFAEKVKGERANAGELQFEWLILNREGLLYQTKTWPEDISFQAISLDQLQDDLLEQVDRVEAFQPSRPPREFRGSEESRPSDSFRPPHHPRPMNRRDMQGLDLYEIKTLGDIWEKKRIAVFRDDQFAFVLLFDLNPLYSTVKSNAYAYISGLPFVVFLVLLCSYWLSAKVIRPVLELNRSITSMGVSNLHERLVLKNADKEFSDLASVYNSMLDRLEKSFNQATRFSSDAAHELKTPLAILQGELEQAIQDAEDASEQQQRLGSLAEEIQNLRQIISKLLYLSQADSGKLKISREKVNFSDLLKDTVLDFELITEDISFDTDIQLSIELYADRILLSQILCNLLSNSVKYNRDQGRVYVQLSQTEKTIVLVVQNTGYAIEAEAASKVFERFYRGDTSHSSKIEGSGLGLSLAFEFARAHDGDLRLVRNKEDNICFELTLPL